MKVVSKILFFLAGSLIVVFSLLSANRSSSHGEGLQLTGQRLYFAREIAPDHIFYPLVAANDRLSLLLADEIGLVNLQLEYAWQRLEYTVELLDKGYRELSFSTLTKGYKYYNTALAEGQQLELSDFQKRLLLTNSGEFESRVVKLWDSFTDPQRQELDRLRAQQTILEQFYIDSL